VGFQPKIAAAVLLAPRVALWAALILCGECQEFVEMVQHFSLARPKFATHKVVLNLHNNFPTA